MTGHKELQKDNRERDPCDKMLSALLADIITTRPNIKTNKREKNRELFKT